MSGSSEAAVFPADGRRVMIYVVYDRRGEVDDFVLHALRGLRAHCAHILVVVNGSLDPAGRAALDEVSDDILVRGNRGYDIWAHKDALAHLGDLSGYDELVMANDTWFGPVRPFGPVFERMDARAVDVWGMTDHAEERPNPFDGSEKLPYHLQSFWIAARRRMFLSQAWRDYWRDLPVMDRYEDAVLLHETAFTEHFTGHGFTADCAFPCAEYPSKHPALFDAPLLLADGCPLLKRRPFFHYPPFLDRHAVIGRETLADVEAYGYPMAAIWRNLARNVPPRTLNADAAMLEVLPEVHPETAPLQTRIAVVANLVHPELVDELLERASFVPGEVDLFLTVPGPDLEAVARASLETHGAAFARVEVRTVADRAGRHMSAFLVACRDVATDDRYELIVKLHTKKSTRKSHNVSEYFRRHQVENLLSSPGYVRHVIDMFSREPGLGVVFPPTIHTGISTLGSGWAGYRARTERLLAQLGSRVPIDEVSPLAPLGGMFIARPAALALLTRREWTYDDYRPVPAYAAAPLHGVQERAIASVAGESGFHCRTILNAEHAAISHTGIEYELDQLSSTTPGYPIEQIQFLHRAGWWGHGGTVALALMYLRLNHPRLARGVDPLARRARGVVVRARGAARRLTGRSSA